MILAPATQTAHVRPQQPASQSAPPLPELYPGQSIQAEVGLVQIITVMSRTDKVYYTVNGAGMHCKTRAKFCQAFMATAPARAN